MGWMILLTEATFIPRPTAGVSVSLYAYWDDDPYVSLSALLYRLLSIIALTRFFKLMKSCANAWFLGVNAIDAPPMPTQH